MCEEGAYIWSMKSTDLKSDPVKESSVNKNGDQYHHAKK